MDTSIADTALAMQRASMGPDLSLLMLKQGVVEAQAVVQVVQQAVQATLPPPRAPHLGQTLDVTA